MTTHPIVRGPRLLLALASALTLVGCLVTSSTDIETADIYARFVAESPVADTIEIQAELRQKDENGTAISLDEGDLLKATVNGTTLEVEHAITSYSARFSDLAATAGVKVQVALERASKASASDSSVSLPDPFAIDAPASDAAHSRASDLVVSWSPTASSGLMKLDLSGGCFETVTEELATDSGSFTVSAGRFKTKDGMADVTCDATLRVTREVEGAIDPAFAGGSSIRGVQSQLVLLTLTP
jgi:hypothetical protein